MGKKGKWQQTKEQEEEMEKEKGGGISFKRDECVEEEVRVRLWSRRGAKGGGKGGREGGASLLVSADD